ncbi:MAG: hypothetical protein J5620_03525 [Alphaproteobacteria bacterium]|nr:hypothetical protein [Alphaproteobacteria bacterium]
MKKEYYDLLESLYWIAFRNIKPSKQLILENDELLSKSETLLYGYLTPDFEEFLPNNNEIIAVASVENDKTGKIEDAEITSFAPDMEMHVPDDMVIAMCGQYYYGVCLLADKLREAFPPLPKESNSIVRRDSPAHDIAFYCYKTYNHIPAKSLYNLLKDVLPEFKIQIPTFNTVTTWYTGFRKGAYQPNATKQQIIMRFPKIFEKFRNANRRI